MTYKNQYPQVVGEPKGQKQVVYRQWPTSHSNHKELAIAHLTALGNKPGELVFLRFFFDKDDSRKVGDKGRKADGKFPNLPWKLIEDYQAEGRGVYFVVNGSGHKDQAVEQCKAIFYEHDNLDRDLSAWLWKELGLPEPTLQIDTGGKSVHSYWLLDEPCSVDDWRTLQTDLLDFSDGDRTLKNPSRVMRLAGFTHPGTQQQATIMTQCGGRYSFNALRKIIPIVKQLAPAVTVPSAIEDQEIERALATIPQRVPNSGTYPIYRNILWALKAHYGEERAIALIEAHSPSKACSWNVVQVCRSGGNRITLGSLFYYAQQHGFEFEQRVISTTTQPSNSKSSREPIQIEPGKIVETIDEIETQLGKSLLPIYVQGGSDGLYLSRIIPSMTDKRHELVEIAKDVNRVEILTSDSLQYELNKRFLFQKYSKQAENWVDIDCPATISRQFFQKGTWPKLPRLTGLNFSPLLCKNGTVVERPGYDRSTGILLQFDQTAFQSIPERVNWETAISALNTLKDWLKEFPFQKPEHQSAALSAVLTAVHRKILRQAPLHAISATKAGTGKGTLARGIAILAQGGHPGTILFTGDSEEFRKKITSFLKAGQPIGLIDNVTGILGGDVLESVLTEPFFKDRLLGTNNIPSLSTQVTLIANGNNLRFRPDMTRRTILCVLDAEVERPEIRVFERDFEAYTQQYRGKLVVAAIAIVKAYIDDGKPNTANRLGSFGDWSDLIRSALIWIGEPDPVKTQEEVASQDDERQTLLALLQSWYTVYGNEPKTAKAVCLEAFRLNLPDLKEVLVDIALDKKTGEVVGRKLGYYLRNHRRSVVSGLRFESVGNDRLGYALWKVEQIANSRESSSASSAAHNPLLINQRFEGTKDENRSSAPRVPMTTIYAEDENRSSTGSSPFQLRLLSMSAEDEGDVSYLTKTKSCLPIEISWFKGSRIALQLGDRVRVIGGQFKEQYRGLVLPIDRITADGIACLTPDGRLTTWLDPQDLELEGGNAA